VLYFAFGSNMDIAHLRSRVPSAEPIGLARLDRFRLGFTRRSIRTGGGVADIVPAEGFSVLGVAFDVDEAELSNLDRAEGVGRSPAAYHRLQIEVRLAGQRGPCPAVAYQVLEPSAEELGPRPDYLARMSAGLAAVKVSIEYKFGAESVHAARVDQYLEFLDWIGKVARIGDPSSIGSVFTRPGFLIARTDSARGHSGIPVIQVSTDAATALSRYGVVSFNGLHGIGRIVANEKLAGNCVAVDQRLRHAVGLRGQLAFGHTGTVHPLDRAPERFLLTRTLALRLSEARIGDAERGLVVMHERNLTLLGVSDGDFVDVIRAVRTGDAGGLTMRRATLRCMTASGEATSGYPNLERVYLDEQCRYKLGIMSGEPYIGTPLLVKPNVRRAAASRVVIYGVTVLLGTSTFTDLLSRLTNLRGAAVALAALAVAFSLTTLLAYLDLRAKLEP
jgi:hypothetical protein